MARLPASCLSFAPWGLGLQDEKHLQNDEELVSMPSYLFSHLQAQYGAKSLVQVRHTTTNGGRL
eukprot:scaffold213812_cov32-Prasinocladus_malaysianus.AAC.1